MMSPLSGWFWLVVAVLAVWTRSPFVGPRLRVIGFVVAAGAMFALGGLLSWVALVAVAAYGWLALGPRRGRVAVAFHLSIFTALLVVSHRMVSDGVGWWPIVPWLGFVHAYMRLVHLLIEVEHGRVAVPAPLTYLAWMVPVFPLAPLQRFPEFLRQLEAPVAPLDLDLVLSALDRITDGGGRVALSLLLRQLVDIDHPGTGLTLVAQIDGLAVSLYLAYAGLQDVLIGAGILIGWRAPESFLFPIGARNVVDFWKRWNVPMAEFFRDYCFNPLLLSLSRTPLGAHPLLVGGIAYMATMVSCGLWHGVELRYLIWGLVQGGALVLCKQYEVVLKQVLGRAGFKRYLGSRWTAAPAWFLTCHFVAFTLLLAWAPLDRTVALLARLP